MICFRLTFLGVDGGISSLFHYNTGLLASSEGPFQLAMSNKIGVNSFYIYVFAPRQFQDLLLVHRQRSRVLPVVLQPRGHRIPRPPQFARTPPPRKQPTSRFMLRMRLNKMDTYFLTRSTNPKRSANRKCGAIGWNDFELILAQSLLAFLCCCASVREFAARVPIIPTASGSRVE